MLGDISVYSQREAGHGDLDDRQRVEGITQKSKQKSRVHASNPGFFLPARKILVKRSSFLAVPHFTYFWVFKSFVNRKTISPYPSCFSRVPERPSAARTTCAAGGSPLRAQAASSARPAPATPSSATRTTGARSLWSLRRMSSTTSHTSTTHGATRPLSSSPSRKQRLSLCRNKLLSSTLSPTTAMAATLVRRTRPQAAQAAVIDLRPR